MTGCYESYYTQPDVAHNLTVPTVQSTHHPITTGLYKLNIKPSALDKLGNPTKILGNPESHPPTLINNQQGTTQLAICLTGDCELRGEAAE